MHPDARESTLLIRLIVRSSTHLLRKSFFAKVPHMKRFAFLAVIGIISASVVGQNYFEFTDGPIGGYVDS